MFNCYKKKVDTLRKLKTLNAVLYLFLKENSIRHHFGFG